MQDGWPCRGFAVPKIHDQFKRTALDVDPRRESPFVLTHRLARAQHTETKNLDATSRPDSNNSIYAQSPEEDGLPIRVLTCRIVKQAVVLGRGEVIPLDYMPRAETTRPEFAD